MANFFSSFPIFQNAGFVCALSLLELLVLFFTSREVTRTVSLSLFWLTRRRHVAIRLFAIVFLPGVVVHEFSHYSVARLLGVHAGGMEFFPQVHGDKVKLGSVTIHHTDVIRRSLIGVAPIIIGFGILLLSFIWYTSFRFSYLSWQTFLLVAIVFEVGNTMFSSKKDIEGSVAFLVLCLIAIILCFVFFPQTISLSLRLITNVLPIMQDADGILGVAIAINCMVLLVFGRVH